jgi:opacity protein-like surface antigen
MLIRARGGALYWNQQGDGPGWSAGGSLAFPIGSDLLLGIGVDHFVPDDHANVPQRTMDPMTVQIEFGAPFRRRITPTFQVGSGVYIMRQTELTTNGSGQLYWTHGPNKNHLGFNAGGGVSVAASSCIGVDLVARYHQAGLSLEPAFRATTVTVSLTYLLPGVRTRRV